jgi:hypothetical protein
VVCEWESEDCCVYFKTIKHYVLSGKILGVSIGGNPCYDLECIVEG